MMAFGLNYNPDGLIFDVSLRYVLNLAEAPHYDWVHTLLTGVFPLEVNLLLKQAVQQKKFRICDVEIVFGGSMLALSCIYSKPGRCTLANIRFVPQRQQ